MMKNSKLQSKQQGATLITSLMMLVVMTIVGVSATKISSSNILVAGNDQQKMRLFQKSQSELLELTTPLKLLPALNTPTLFVNDEYVIIQESGSLKTELITKGKDYSCNGINGRALTENTPCILFDFRITSRSPLGGAKEESHRGAGKEVPPISPNNFIRN